MYMIFICANLQKLDLISLLDLYADILQHPLNGSIKYRTSVFGRKDQLVQQDRNMIALVYVLAHARSVRRKQRGIYPLVIQMVQWINRPGRSAACVRFSERDANKAERRSLLLGGLFAHGQAEDFGQCGIENGTGLLLDLLYGFIEGAGYSFRFVGSQFIKHLGDGDNAGEQRCAVFS